MILPFSVSLVWLLSPLLNFFFFFFLLFWPHWRACRILVPQLGTDPKPSVMKAQAKVLTTGPSQSSLVSLSRHSPYSPSVVPGHLITGSLLLLCPLPRTVVPWILTWLMSTLHAELRDALPPTPSKGTSLKHTVVYLQSPLLNRSPMKVGFV